jgi:hypothetical protein
MWRILLAISKRGINVPHDESKSVRVLTKTGRPETTKPATLGGFLRYRYGDSNPGFRRERAAS